MGKLERWMNISPNQLTATILKSSGENSLSFGSVEARKQLLLLNYSIAYVVKNYYVLREGIDVLLKKSKSLSIKISDLSTTLMTGKGEVQSTEGNDGERSWEQPRPHRARAHPPSVSKI